jgi:hypothetical protein
MIQGDVILNRDLAEDFGYYDKKNPLIYRCRGCNNNLSANDPASQYQRQKIIQKTVRVPASVFTMNLGALSAYERPNVKYNLVDISGSTYIVSPGVNWNQMSDRREPHIQVVKNGAGSGYHSSSTKRTITSNRPGAMSPGGAGVDIKHNSYDRYLNRIKGKAPMRRGVIPPKFGEPYIPFLRVDPIYGGKVMKTSIVNGCNCPIVSDGDNRLYKDSSTQDQILAVNYKYNVGDYVWARKFGDNSGESYKAQIIAFTNNLFTIKFPDGIIEYVTSENFSIYFDCKGCVSNSQTNELLLYSTQSEVGAVACELLTALGDGQLI